MIFSGTIPVGGSLHTLFNTNTTLITDKLEVCELEIMTLKLLGQVDGLGSLDPSSSAAA